MVSLSVSPSKPWIARDIEVLLNHKGRAFMAGDNEDTQKEIQREMRRVRNITGMTRVGGAVEGTKEHANKLNLFFYR